MPVIRPVSTRIDTWSSASFTFLALPRPKRRRAGCPKRLEMPCSSTATVFNSLALMAMNSTPEIAADEQQKTVGRGPHGRKRCRRCLAQSAFNAMGPPVGRLRPGWAGPAPGDHDHACLAAPHSLRTLLQPHHRSQPVLKLGTVVYLIGGPPRCGKSTLARWLATNYAIPFIPTDLIWAVVSVGQSEWRSSMQKGPDRIPTAAKRLEPYLQGAISCIQTGRQ